VPHDNPYAAPQTLQPQFDLATLPIAQLQQPGGQRRRYPDQSTAQLQRLLDKSQPLEAMLWVWLALWFVTVAFLGALFLRASASSEMPKWFGWSLIAAITARLLCNIIRTKLGRWYMLLVDAALLFACVAAFVALLTKMVLLLNNVLIGCLVGLIPGTIAGIIARWAYRSCKTLIQAHELFQPVCVQHDDLQRELAYRKEHGID
jgi:hypothetical protein